MGEWETTLPHAAKDVMETSTNFPLEHIAQKVMSSGVRWPKRVLLRDKKPAWQSLPAYYNQQNRGSYVPTRPALVALRADMMRRSWEKQQNDKLQASRQTSVDWSGNLSGDEYRFWIGTPCSIGLKATCRCCSKLTFGALERLAHKLAEGCTIKLVAAYKKLLADSNCVVCDVRVYGNENSFGVPMHKQCQLTWKFAQRRYMALDFELGVPSDFENTSKHIRAAAEAARRAEVNFP